MEETWVTTQKKTFGKWVDRTLQKRGMSLESLEDDLVDGVKLVNLLEELSGSKINGWSHVTKLKIQCLQNLSLALDFCVTEGIKLVGIGTTDIHDKNLKLILGLIWMIILRYQIQSSEGSTNKALLEWVREQTKGIYDGPVTNFTRDWSNGHLLTSLVQSMCYDPDLGYKEDPIDEITIAMQVAERELQIPNILDPNDMAHAPDDLSTMTYISYFMNTPRILFKPLEIDAKEPTTLSLSIARMDSVYFHFEKLNMFFVSPSGVRESIPYTIQSPSPRGSIEITITPQEFGDHLIEMEYDGKVGTHGTLVVRPLFEIKGETLEPQAIGSTRELSISCEDLTYGLFENLEAFVACEGKQEKLKGLSFDEKDQQMRGSLVAKMLGSNRIIFTSSGIPLIGYEIHFSTFIKLSPTSISLRAGQESTISLVFEELPESDAELPVSIFLQKGAEEGKPHGVAKVIDIAQGCQVASATIDKDTKSASFQYVFTRADSWVNFPAFGALLTSVGDFILSADVSAHKADGIINVTVLNGITIPNPPIIETFAGQKLEAEIPVTPFDGQTALVADCISLFQVFPSGERIPIPFEFANNTISISLSTDDTPKFTIEIQHSGELVGSIPVQVDDGIKLEPLHDDAVVYFGVKESEFHFRHASRRTDLDSLVPIIHNPNGGTTEPENINWEADSHAVKFRPTMIGRHELRLKHNEKTLTDNVLPVNVVMGFTVDPIEKKSHFIGKPLTKVIHFTPIDPNLSVDIESLTFSLQAPNEPEPISLQVSSVDESSVQFQLTPQVEGEHKVIIQCHEYQIESDISLEAIKPIKLIPSTSVQNPYEISDVFSCQLPFGEDSPMRSSKCAVYVVNPRTLQKRKVENPTFENNQLQFHTNEFQSLQTSKDDTNFEGFAGPYTIEFEYDGTLVEGHVDVIFPVKIEPFEYKLELTQNQDFTFSHSLQWKGSNFDPKGLTASILRLSEDLSTPLDIPLQISDTNTLTFPFKPSAAGNYQINFTYFGVPVPSNVTLVVSEALTLMNGPQKLPELEKEMGTVEADDLLSPFLTVRRQKATLAQSRERKSYPQPAPTTPSFFAPIDMQVEGITLHHDHDIQFQLQPTQKDFTFDLNDITVEIITPSGDVIDQIVKTDPQSPTSISIQYKLAQIGPNTIKIKYQGTPIPGSVIIQAIPEPLPISVNIPPGLENSKIFISLDETPSVGSLSQQNMKAHILTPLGKRILLTDAHLSPKSKYSMAANFVPTEPGEHRLQITDGVVTLPDLRLTFSQTPVNLSSITLPQQWKDIHSKITIPLPYENIVIDRKKLEVIIISPSGNHVVVPPSSWTLNDRNGLQFTLCPQSTGTYQIQIAYQSNKLEHDPSPENALFLLTFVDTVSFPVLEFGKLKEIKKTVKGVKACSKHAFTLQLESVDYPKEPVPQGNGTITAFLTSASSPALVPLEEVAFLPAKNKVQIKFLVKTIQEWKIHIYFRGEKVDGEVILEMDHEAELTPRMQESLAHIPDLPKEEMPNRTFGFIFLTVHNGEKLKHDKTDKSGPHVDILLGNKKKFETTKADKPVNPLWDQSFNLILKDDLPCELQFQLGTAVVSLPEEFDSQKFDLPVILDGVPFGNLNVSAKCTSPTTRIPAQNPTRQTRSSFDLLGLKRYHIGGPGELTWHGERAWCLPSQKTDCIDNLTWKPAGWELTFDVDRKGTVDGWNANTGEQWKKHNTGTLIDGKIDLVVFIENDQRNIYKGVIYGNKAEVVITIEVPHSSAAEQAGSWRRARGRLWEDFQHPKDKEERRSLSKKARSVRGLVREKSKGLIEIASVNKPARHSTSDLKTEEKDNFRRYSSKRELQKEKDKDKDKDKEKDKEKEKEKDKDNKDKDKEKPVKEGISSRFRGAAQNSFRRREKSKSVTIPK